MNANNLPISPEGVYKNKGWEGWKNFLGNEFKSFKEARKFARGLHFTTYTEWKEYCKSGKRPLDIPSNPNHFYKDKGWIEYGDFLGANIVANSNKKFMKFKEARKFAHLFKIKGQREWFKYWKKNTKPKDLPQNPSDYYKDEGWISWGDFLGNKFIYHSKMVYRPFEEAREFVRKLKLKKQKEWGGYCSSGKKPKDIPSNPHLVYKGRGWKGTGDFIGTDRISNQNRKYRSYKEARRFARNLKLKNCEEWEEYCKSGDRPIDIPSNPNRTYRNDGWKGMGDFLGTNRIATRNKEYRSFKEARKFARSLRLKSSSEWKRFIKSSKKPEDIPNSPDNVYKEKGWTDWGDFLGTGNIATFNKEYRPFKKSRKFARKLRLKTQKEWFEYCKSSKKPKDIPACPQKTYKNKGWEGTKDFLGTSKG